MARRMSMHKRSISMLQGDIEKMDHGREHGDTKYPERKSVRKDLLVIMAVILVFGTALHIFLLTNLLTLDGFDGLRNAWKKNFGDVVENDLKNIINIDSIDSKNLNEWDKFVNKEEELTGEGELNAEVINQILRNNKIPEDYYDSLHRGEDKVVHEQDDDVELEQERQSNPQLDLAEILTINPIVLLVNDENLMKQERAKQILFSLNMAPELQTINLQKHPNYDSILSYLKKLEVDINYDASDIPRLFVSGSPVAGYSDIIDKYDHGQLVAYLREMGMSNLELS